MSGDLPVTPTVLAVVVGICVAIVIGSWLIERRQDRNKRIVEARAEWAAWTKGEVPPVDDLEPLNADDRALVELLGPTTWRPGQRTILASGRIITGWELAQLAPDLVTLEIRDDHSQFLARELAHDAGFRKAYTALPSDHLMSPDDLTAIEDAVAEEPLAVDPTPTLGQERVYADHTPVQYGTVMVGSGCLRARRDYATDHICAECVAAFGRVGS